MCTSSCGNDYDCPCQADHCCALTEDCDGTCDDCFNLTKKANSDENKEIQWAIEKMLTEKHIGCMTAHPGILYDLVDLFFSLRNPILLASKEN